MRYCNKCLESSWLNRYVQGYVIATCNICGNEEEIPNKNTIKRYAKQARKDKRKDWVQPRGNQGYVKHSIFPKNYWAHDEGSDNQTTA